MPGRDIRISASEGGAFDAYIAEPDGSGKVPAIVLASAVHGVTDDHRAFADLMAANGYVAVAPDLFWRSIPGPLGLDDERTKVRSQPRADIIRTGEADFLDTMAYVRALPRFNGRAAIIGFCYGGPYAIIGPKRLGFDAGISCHGSVMANYLAELDGVTKPISINFGDQDHAAPPEVLEGYRAAADRMPNLALNIYPGAKHGYMFKGHPKAYDEPACQASTKRVLEIMATLKA